MPSKNDLKNQECKEHIRLSSGDLQNILEVNKKAIEIHLEVERQNEDIIKDLTYCKDKIDRIDTNLFRLVVILSSIGISSIISLIFCIMQFLSHK